MSTQPSAASRTLTVASIEVGRIGLGTNRLTSTPGHHEFLREAVEAGLGMIDTAHVYSGGDSERAIGEALSPKADGLVVATKGGYSGRGSPEELRAQIEQSLESLRTDVIDLYYLHRVDPETPLEVSLGVIAEYRDAGRIKEVGVSAVSVEQVEAARRVVPIAAVQNHYNVADRGLGRRGRLLRARTGSSSCRTTRSRAAGRLHSRTSRRATGRLRSRSHSPGCCGAHRSTLPIPGTLSIDHLREDLSALEIELTDEEFEALS